MAQRETCRSSVRPARRGEQDIEQQLRGSNEGFCRVGESLGKAGAVLPECRGVALEKQGHIFTRIYHSVLQKDVVSDLALLCYSL